MQQHSDNPTSCPIGGCAALARYERQRLAANTAMAAGLHTMQRLMISDDPLVVSARSLGE